MNFLIKKFPAGKSNKKAKKMGLKSRVDVVLNIDDKTFSVSVSNLTKEQEETLKSRYDVSKNRIDKERTMRSKVERYQLLKSAGKFEEALTILDEIEAIENEIGVKDPIESSEILNGVYQSRFLMSVSGSDKERLKTYVDERNISYMDLMQYIEKEVAKGKYQD